MIAELIAACIAQGLPPSSPVQLVARGGANADPLTLVDSKTLKEIVRVESGGRSLAINVNNLRNQPAKPRSEDEAEETANFYISRGYTVDLGLAQINSRNLASLGLTVRMVLNPCTNLRAGATILVANYRRASQLYGEGQGALLAALSAYNTGDFARGFANGYVARYTVVPALASQVGAQAQAPPVQVSARSAAVTRRSVRLNPLTADTAVAWGPGHEED